MMKIRILTFLVAFAFSAGGALGQSLDKVLSVGDRSFDTKDYYTAFRCYEEVLKYVGKGSKIKQDTLQVKFRYAEAARRFNYLQAADSMYSRVMEEAPDLAPDLYARSVFRLAQVKQSRAKDSIGLNYNVLNVARLDTARQLYQLFLSDAVLAKLDASPERREAYRRAAANGIESCTFAIEKNGQVPADTIFRLSDRINTPFSDLAPVLRGGDLFFSSIKYYGKRESQAKQSRTYSKVHRARFMPGDAQLAEAAVQLLPEEGVFNEDHFHTAHTAFSSDGNWMFFSRCYQQKDSIYCTLYRRVDKGDGTWGKPEYLLINVDSTRYTSQQPSIARMGGKEWLLFASNRPGTLGGLDLWRAELRLDGSLGEPENLAGINSPDNEATPFFHELSGQLFFSSDREPSFGLYDLFVSNYEDGAWSAPDNLGMPYNSGYNDQYYFLSPDGSQAYFSSDRPESTRFLDSLDACCQDIYGYPINIYMQLDPTVLACGEEVTGQAQIKLYDLTPGEDTTRLVRFDSLKRYHRYRLEVLMPGFRPEQAELFLDQRYRGQDIVHWTIELKPEFLDVFFTAYDVQMPHLTYSGDKLNILFNGEAPLAGERPRHYRLDWGAPLALYAQADFRIYKPIDTLLTLADINYDACVDTILLPLQILPVNDTLLIFYFDNDKPDRDRPSPTDRSKRYWPLTKFSFEETLDPYYAKKAEYLEYNLRSERIPIDREVNSRRYRIGDQEYLRVGKDSVEVRQAGNSLVTIIDTFVVTGIVNRLFDDELRGVLYTLNDLCGYLEDWLSTKRDFEMEVQGFCSIRGNMEYNDSLANRRILCIQLSMEGYKNGVLKDYIRQGQLRLAPKPVGASEASTVFRNPRMNPNSDEGGIYSLPAMLDRRVELRVKDANLSFRPPSATSSESNLQIPGQ